MSNYIQCVRSPCKCTCFVRFKIFDNKTKSLKCQEYECKVETTLRFSWYFSPFKLACHFIFLKWKLLA
jgi:hypothetical protein